MGFEQYTNVVNRYNNRKTTNSRLLFHLRKGKKLGIVALKEILLAPLLKKTLLFRNSFM